MRTSESGTFILCITAIGGLLSLVLLMLTFSAQVGVASPVLSVESSDFSGAYNFDGAYNTDTGGTVDTGGAVGTGGAVDTGGTVDSGSCTIRGDMNADCVVTSLDALMILQISVGNIPMNISIADIDGNGVVNSVDALMVLQASVGTISLV